MNPYFFLFYCSYVMVRKLTYKPWMEWVPDSAMYFLNGLGFMFVGAILYYVGGPLPRDQYVMVIVKGLSIVIAISLVNYFIFSYKARYKMIVEKYDRKYANRPPILLYYIVPVCYGLLAYCISRVHDHYGDYYRINSLK